MAEADIIGAIVAGLKADASIAALAAGRVFGGELPAEETSGMPREAIVVRPSVGASLTAGSFADHDTQRIDVLAYGATPFAANAVSSLARRALTAIRRQVIGGCLIHWVDRAGGFSAGRDKDAAWPVAFQSFQVFHALEAVP